jgi:hypothetical protein
MFAADSLKPQFDIAEQVPTELAKTVIGAEQAEKTAE